MRERCLVLMLPLMHMARKAHMETAEVRADVARRLLLHTCVTELGLFILPRGYHVSFRRGQSSPPALRSHMNEGN